MGCGCKKKNQNQPVQVAPNNVTINMAENQTNQGNQTPAVTLTEEQQKQVDAIVDKINQIKS